jgi:hypothetical protein
MSEAQAAAADKAAAEQEQLEEQEHAAAERAFKHVVTGEPQEVVKDDLPPSEETPEQKKAREAEQKKAAQEAAKKAYDEWMAAVPSAVREKIERVDKMAETVNQVGRFERHLNKVEERVSAVEKAGKAAAAAARAAGGEAPSADQIKAAVANLKKWNQMKDDFPDWADAMEERLSVFGAPAANTEPAQKINQDEIVGKIRFQLNAERVEEVHEGWQDTVKTPEFKEWLQRQPDDVRALAESERVKDAVSLLDKFKEHRNKAADIPPPETPEQKKARLAAAMPPTTGRTMQQRGETETEAEAAAKRFAQIRSG